MDKLFEVFMVVFTVANILAAVLFVLFLIDVAFGG